MILIIEHDSIISQQFKERLDFYNLNYKIANSGVEAYKLLLNKDKNFDYIITNIVLPDENGIEIIKFTKKKFNSKIIIYTNKNYNLYKDKIDCDYFFNKKKINPYKIIDMINNNLI